MPFNNLLALSSEQLLFAYGILFVGVVLFVESLLQLLISHRFAPKARINRRLRMLDSGIDPREVLQRLRRRRAEERDDRLNLLVRLEWMIIRAGLTISTRRFILVMVSVALLVTAAVRLSGAADMLVASGAGLISGVLLPLQFLRFMTRRRLRRFSEQLPEAIDLIVRSLKAGHPLNAGLGMAADELPDPIGSEFGIVVDETTYGLDLRDAISHMSRRIDLPDINYLSIAVRIHYGTGGNLAEVLENLSKLIRARFTMFRKVRAITAEGRLSAWFLSLFPIGMGAVLISIKSDYYAPIRDDPLFPWLAGLTVVLLVINVVVMRWMVNIKV